jgi:hypothetical protein
VAPSSVPTVPSTVDLSPTAAALIVLSPSASLLPTLYAHYDLMMLLLHFVAELCIWYYGRYNEMNKDVDSSFELEERSLDKCIFLSLPCIVLCELSSVPTEASRQA